MKEQSSMSQIDLRQRLNRLSKELKTEPSLKRIIDADLEHNVKALRLMRSAPPAAVTYRDFSRLGKKRGWTVDMLVELFKGRLALMIGKTIFMRA